MTHWFKNENGLKIAYQDEFIVLIEGDVRDVLPKLPAGIAQTCVTSPPYFGLRDYGTAEWLGGDPECDHKHSWANDSGGMRESHNVVKQANAAVSARRSRGVCKKCGAVRADNQIGLERNPEIYLQTMVIVFSEIQRVMRKTGTIWLNLGDSYANDDKWGGSTGGKHAQGVHGPNGNGREKKKTGMKPKDLMGMPWKVAQQLQEGSYRGVIRNELDRVWLAAIIDGEGTICGSNHTRPRDGTSRTTVQIFITNSNIDLLDRAFEIYPTSRCQHNPHTNGHLGTLPIFRWVVQGIAGKSQLLQEIYPYLIAKKQQALLAWNFLEMSKVAKKMGKTPQAPAMRERRVWIVEALSKLNHAQEVEIPDWIKEPPSCMHAGWWLRSPIVWAKPNPMPESVKDRPTKSYEHIFLMSAGKRYFYDREPIKEPASEKTNPRRAMADQSKAVGGWASGSDNDHSAIAHAQGRSTPGRKFGTREEGIKNNPSFSDAISDQVLPMRNARDIWHIPTEPYEEAHFATFPSALPRRCILAGTSEKGQCSKCGKPYIRIVEKVTSFESGSGKSGNEILGKGDHELGHNNKNIRKGPVVASSTVGWSTSKGRDRSAGNRNGEGQSTLDDESQAPTRTVGWTKCCAGVSEPQVVLEPFAGAGTTLIVAKNLGRRVIGIELNPDYCQMIIRRIKEATIVPYGELGLIAQPVKEDTELPLFDMEVE